MTIEEKVKQIICEQLGIKEVKNNDKFTDDNICADELDMIELCMAFEEKWGFEIEDGDVEKLVTIQDAINYIIGRLK